MSSTAYADQAAVLVGVDALVGAYSLPAPNRTNAHVDPSAMFDGPNETTVRELLRGVPPALFLWFRTTAEMSAWAAHLGYTINVCVRPINGRAYRMITATGAWLGWQVNLLSDEDNYRDVTPPVTLAIVRRAHMGVI